MFCPLPWTARRDCGRTGPRNPFLPMGSQAMIHPPLLQRLWRIAAAALVAALGCVTAAAADFREPLNQTFVIWPQIPVVRASDLGDYAQDRKAFSDLHADKADPQKLLAALQAVDELQAHHERTALAQLGRTLNTQLIGELDRQTRRINTRSPKLRFDFAGITPQELQGAATLDAKALDGLRAKAGQVTLVAYITYTRMEGALVQATATLVKLASGASQSFTVTAPAPALAEVLAREIFDYFQGTRFSQHRNPLADREWLTAAPGHADQLVSRDVAQRYCTSQQADLPTAEELETAEASGFYGGGVALRNNGVYHVRGGLYDTAQGLADKVRPNHIASVPNGHYYCVRRKAAPAATAARPRK